MAKPPPLSASCRRTLSSRKTKSFGCRFTTSFRSSRAATPPASVPRSWVGSNRALPRTRLTPSSSASPNASRRTTRRPTSSSFRPACSSLHKTFTGQQLRQIMYAMLGAVIVVLLIACVNVMNMQFGRAALRSRELAIRGALGATRGRIVRQMLTESFLIALLGAVVGVALAYWAVDLLAQITSTPQFQLPYWIVFTIDAKVLGFTLGAVLLATFVSGLVPALLAARGNASEMMKEGGRGNSSRLVNVITRILVVGQIAMTAALSDRLGSASSFDPQPGETGLRLRRRGNLCGTHGSLRRRLSDGRFAAAVLPTCRARAPHQSGI